MQLSLCAVLLLIDEISLKSNDVKKDFGERQ